MRKAPNRTAPDWPTLLGDGNAWIVGLPSGFDLEDKLRSTQEIRLATAFAHLSGWKYFRHVASHQSAKMFLLTGLDCWQTEPQLLRAWYDLMMSAPNRIEAKIARADIFFHPKVLIGTSEDDQGGFAIVGSGNLSQGGLCDNVECGIYVEDRRLIADIKNWFDRQFESAKRITEEGVAAYARSYKPNIKRRRKLEGMQLSLRTRIEKHAETKMAEWDRAVRETIDFLANYGLEQRRKAEEGALEIKRALRYPHFDLDRNGLDRFFEIRFLGHLRETLKPRIWNQRQRLRRALRTLIAEPDLTLPKLLDPSGSLKVQGVSLNTISKILAVHDPESWPVFNERAKDVLKEFGYKAPRGASTTGRYLAYRDLMRKFRLACEAAGCKDVNAFALDAFILKQSGRLMKYKKAR